MATKFVALVIALTLLFIASLVGKPLEKKSVVSSENPRQQILKERTKRTVRVLEVFTLSYIAILRTVIKPNTANTRVVY